MTENTSRSQTVHRWYTRPVFFVADGNRAAGFYVETLGFEKGWHEGDGAGKVCHVNHGECEIVLCEDATRRDRARLFIELTSEGLADLRREFVERSVPTKETWWGYDTLQVDDPDGYSLVPTEQHGKRSWSHDHRRRMSFYHQRLRARPLNAGFRQTGRKRKEAQVPGFTLRKLLRICCSAMLLLPGVLAHAQQQIVDPDFKPVVEKPAYLRSGPIVGIDEAHSNFHTAGGQYKPFADLLTNDGYRVIASTRKFETGILAGIDVLVIANARDLAALRAGNLSSPAFSEHECDVVRDWVRDGGSLLLIADHAPYGNAADNLAKRFGVNMGKGWAFDRASTSGITTQLVFSRENGLLGAHPILAGRNASEEVKSVRSFTGQSLGVPPGATILLKLSATAREASTPDDLDAEDAAARSADTSKGAIGSHSSPVVGRAQGLAMTSGKGRVVVLGEAGLFSAQILRFTDGNQQRETKFGMNVPGNDDRQFALNVLHWLSGLLK